MTVLTFRGEKYATSVDVADAIAANWLKKQYDISLVLRHQTDSRLAEEVIGYYGLSRPVTTDVEAHGLHPSDRSWLTSRGLTIEDIKSAFGRARAKHANIADVQ